MFFLFCAPFLLWSTAPYSIVYVHIGHKLPSYLEFSLHQSRLFNEQCPLILIANECALESFDSSLGVKTISCESLPLTAEHQAFQKRTKLSDQVMEGYSRYTSERFLYLYDYMAFSGDENLFYLENDVLVYVDLGKLLPIFKEFYPGIAATFESDFKCVPGLMYFAHKEPMQQLANYFAIKASKRLWDMEVLALFWQNHPEIISSLPMIMESYVLKQSSASLSNRLLKKKLRYCNHLDEFKSIFDGAAIGIFFDGLDPSKGDSPPGTVRDTLFNPSWLNYKWEIDEKGRRVPYMIYEEEIYPINNLHIASKRLEQFVSEGTCKTPLK